MTETQNLISQRKIFIERLDFELWNCPSTWLRMVSGSNHFRFGIWSLEFISQTLSNNQDAKRLHSTIGAGSN